MDVTRQGTVELRGRPWVHLDIAGPGMLSGPHHYWPKGGTGFGAQLLAHWLSQR